jgi:hypothetical protein
MGIEQSISRIVNAGADIGQAAAPLAQASGHPEIAAGMQMAPMAMQAMGLKTIPSEGGMGQQQPQQLPPVVMPHPMPSPQPPNMGMPQPLPPIAHRQGQMLPQVAQMLGMGGNLP